MILYTSPTIVKRDTPLGSQVDDNLLYPYIRMAQDKEILPYLGTKLDEKLKADITADTLTGNYQTLLEDYIVHSLVQFTFAMIAPMIRVRFSNNSVTVVSSEQGQAASTSDIKPIVDHARQMGEFYRERMIEHITHNLENFPEYQTNTGEDLHPTRNNYFEGLNLDRATYDNQTKAFLSAIGANKFI